MTEQNSNRAWLEKFGVDKGIRAGGAGNWKTDWPAPCRGDAPMTVDPHGPDRDTAEHRRGQAVRKELPRVGGD